MKRLYINANCQGPAIKLMLSEVLTDWQVESLPVHEPHSEEALKSASRFMADADVIVSQPISNSYPTKEFRSDSIRDIARSNAQIEWFPSIYFVGQQLTLCTLRQNGKRLDTPGWLYHDCVVASLIGDGCTIEQVVERMKSRELFSRAFVENEVRRIVQDNIKREKQLACTITVSDIFEQHVASRVLCHTFNHPARHVLVHVCNRILDAIGSSKNVPEDGVDHLRFPHYPLLPSVAFHLGEVFATEDFQFHWASKSLAFDDYIGSMFRAYRNLDRDQIRASLAESVGVSEFLSRFQAAS